MDELWHPIDLQLPEIIRSHTVIMLKRPTDFLQRMKEFHRCQEVGIHRLLKENPEAWHLEMIAVHPSLQGKGIGKLAMKAIFDYVDQAPILIECSSEKNLPFYKSLNFTTLEEVEMVDAPQFDGDTGRVKQWLMIRESSVTKRGEQNNLDIENSFDRSLSLNSI
jgi:GNAT superfamily N-acetyltransferase